MTPSLHNISNSPTLGDSIFVVIQDVNADWRLYNHLVMRTRHVFLMVLASEWGTLEADRKSKAGRVPEVSRQHLEALVPPYLLLRVVASLQASLELFEIMYAMIFEHFYISFRALVLRDYTQKYLAALVGLILFLQALITRFRRQIGQDLSEFYLFYCRAHHYPLSCRHFHCF